MKRNDRRSSGFEVDDLDQHDQRGRDSVFDLIPSRSQQIDEGAVDALKDYLSTPIKAETPMVPLGTPSSDKSWFDQDPLDQEVEVSDTFVHTEGGFICVG